MSVKTSINTIVDPQELLNSISKLKVLIIGDVMIDSYLWGRVDRISPEAPVPVVSIRNTDKRLGGAANVALNAQALGASPVLCSVIGNDREGDELLHLLQNNNLSTEGIVSSNSRITTIKHRVLSGSHHMIRLDSEQDTLLDKEEFSALMNRLEVMIPEADVVIFEDYDKGVISENLIKQTVDICQKHGIPTVVDPKKRNFLSYHNVSLFKPNKKELIEGLKLNSTLASIPEVRQSVELLRKELSPDLILITLSEQGVFVQSDSGDCHIPAHKREICDVSGAGDTVISVAALCYALRLAPENIAALSNLAGGIVCEQVGVVPIDKTIFINEIRRLNLLVNVSGNPEQASLRK